MSKTHITGTGNGLANRDDLSGPSPSSLLPKKDSGRHWAFLWQFWKDYAERIAHYQTALLLAIIYVFIAGPTALLARLVGHRFLPNLPTGATTLWHDAVMGRSSTPADYRRQF